MPELDFNWDNQDFNDLLKDLCKKSFDIKVKDSSNKVQFKTTSKLPSRTQPPSYCIRNMLKEKRR